jgi:hypothetical protein
MKSLSISVFFIVLVAALGAQEPSSTSPVVLEQPLESGASAAPPTDTPVKVVPGIDPNQVETTQSAPSQEGRPPQLENEPGADNVQTAHHTQTRSPNAAESRISFANILPWCFAILMALLAGAATTYIVILRRQERHFSSLRENVISGSTPVHLLPEEATRLIREFHLNIEKGASYFDQTIKSQRKELEQIVGTSEASSRASHEETKRTVETFKGSLNEMLVKISKFMERVAQDTKETHKQALETKEFSKQVAALIHDKELEISKLKEGYHLHLINPLTKAFLKIRDDIHLLANHTTDPQIGQQLTDLDQRIGNALSDLQIEEIPIQVGERPHEIHHSRFWESLGAAEPTDDPLQHGAIARIPERGYQIRTNNGEPHIIRKAVVVIHSCSIDNDQHNIENITQN